MPLSAKKGFLLLLLLYLGFILYRYYLKFESTDSSRTRTEKAETIGEEKRVRYSFTLRNKTPDALKDSEVRIFAPVKQTASQRLVVIEVSEPHEVLSDKFGNQVLKFLVDVPPYGTKIISLEVLLKQFTTPVPTELDDPKLYLGDGDYINLEHPQIAKTAAELRGESPRQTAKRIFDWVSSTLKSESYIREDRGAGYAIEQRKGDCTEFSYLTLALLRRNGIPARMMGGFVLGRSPVLKGRAYHNWVEFYDGSSWHVIDAQEKVFSKTPRAYIGFRVIAAGEASPMSSTQRFLAFDDRLEVHQN